MADIFFIKDSDKWTILKALLIADNWIELSDKDADDLKSVISDFVKGSEIIPLLRDLKSDDVICGLKFPSDLRGIGIVDLSELGMGIVQLWDTIEDFFWEAPALLNSQPVRVK